MDLVGRLAAAVTNLARIKDRVLVGVDGPDVAGKTTLADRLAGVLQVPTLRRALVRDVDLFGSHEEVRRRYLGRYLPGQALYRSEVDPEALAHVVVDNERVDAPRIERWRVPEIEPSETRVEAAHRE